MRDLDPLTFLVAESLMGTQHPDNGDPSRRKGPIAVGADPRREDACLVLLAHGSKDPRWRAPFERLSGELQAGLGQGKVRLAYMEFTGPTLMDVACECVGQMTLQLRILPLFMAVGAHLATDIPEQVAAVRGQFPQITVKVLPPVGEDPRLLALVEQIAFEAARA